ncbi:MAG: CpaF family protein [Lachnospiraceae bacterium]|nr:CpaF family protein [Lachnospiraceae bacterium]
MQKEGNPNSWEEQYRLLRKELLHKLAGMPDAEDEEVRKLLGEMVLAHARTSYLSIDDRIRMERELFHSVRRLDILQDYLDDHEVTEIMVNGPDCIFIEKNGHVIRAEQSFSSAEKLEDVIRQIAGQCNRVINERMPIVDARLRDGSRVNAVVAPAALEGPILTIRRFPEDPITMEDLIRYGSITEEASSLLITLVRAGYSLIVSGGTSAGKTTFLNVLSGMVPKEERIITIEDNAELQIRGIPNLVRLEAKNANMEGAAEITIRDLIKSALRMRPDRIIVGEIRSGEAVDMLQAFNTGHDGSLCTIHANSCEDTVSRLETMVLMALPIPLPAIRRQIASGVDILVHLGRLEDRRRRVLEIAEIDGMDRDSVTMHALYRYDPESKSLERTGNLRNVRKLRQAGMQLDQPPLSDKEDAGD